MSKNKIGRPYPIISLPPRYTLFEKYIIKVTGNCDKRTRNGPRLADSRPRWGHPEWRELVVTVWKGAMMIISSAGSISGALAPYCHLR